MKLPSITIPNRMMVATLLILNAWGCVTPANSSTADSGPVSRQQLVHFTMPVTPDEHLDEPFAEYRKFWLYQTPSQETYQNARILLYKIIASNKLNKEQLRQADQLSLALEHAKLMHQASQPAIDTPEQLQRALAGAIRLSQLRKHGPRLPYPRHLAELEQSLADPFNLELMQAAQNMTPLRPLSLIWNQVPAEHAPWGGASDLHLRAVIQEPSAPKQKLFLLFKALPEDAVISVNQMPQKRFPANAKHSFRIPLGNQYVGQTKFKIDIHIPRPPLNFRLATPWLTRLNP